MVNISDFHSEVEGSIPLFCSNYLLEENMNAADALEIINNFNTKNWLPAWYNYNAVSRFKSVKRAIKRGHVNLVTGAIYPDRPFNNRKPTLGRKLNENKKTIYGRIGRL